jgi:hypothetical protein
MSMNLIVSDQIPLDTQHKAVSKQPQEPIAFGLCCVPLTHFAKHPPMSDGCGRYAPRHSARLDAGPEPIVRAWDRRIQWFNYPNAAIHAFAFSDWNLASSAEATYSDFSYLCIRPQQISNILRSTCPMVSTTTPQGWRTKSSIVTEYQPAREGSKRSPTHQETTRIAIYDLSRQIYSDSNREPRPTPRFWERSGVIEMVDRCT